MRDAGDFGNPGGKAAAALAALLSVMVAAGTACGRSAANPQSARAELTAPIPARLNCAVLVQDGAARNMNVPAWFRSKHGT